MLFIIQKKKKFIAIIFTKNRALNYFSLGSFLKVQTSRTWVQKHDPHSKNQINSCLQNFSKFSFRWGGFVCTLPILWNQLNFWNFQQMQSYKKNLPLPKSMVNCETLAHFFIKVLIEQDKQGEVPDWFSFHTMEVSNKGIFAINSHHCCCCAPLRLSNKPSISNVPMGLMFPKK